MGGRRTNRSTPRLGDDQAEGREGAAGATDRRGIDGRDGSRTAMGGAANTTAWSLPGIMAAICSGDAKLAADLGCYLVVHVSAWRPRWAPGHGRAGVAALPNLLPPQRRRKP